MANGKYKRLQSGPVDFKLSNSKHCAVDGCSRECRARGYCKMHWARWRKHGDPLGGSWDKPKMPDTCEIEGCKRESRSRWKMGITVCAMHYLRRMQTGSFDDPYANASPDGVCMASGCVAEVRSTFGQYCEAHYYQIRRERLKDDPHYKDQQRRHHADRRARELTAFVESVSRAKVMARDKWICHLCQDKIPKAAKHPHALSATLDHIVPLARGGLHSYANIKAAHLSCNVRKGASIVGQLGLEFAQ